MIDPSSVICAQCQRCGRRSALGRGDTPALAALETAEPRYRLRCDMCGCRRVQLFRARRPAELVAFLARQGA